MDQGIVYADEIFQSLEPAHRLAFGYGSLVWEYRDGARSWLFPGALSVPMKLAALLGVSSGVGVVVAAKTALIAFCAYAIHRALQSLSTRGQGDAIPWAAALLLTFPPFAVYGARAMGEMAAAALLLLVLAALARSGRGAAAIAGILMGCCTFIHYQTGIFAPVLLVALLWQRRWRDASFYVGVGLLVALLGGLLDAWVWGTLFHSLRTYVRFNWIENGASRWGVQPADFYWQTFRAAVGWMSYPLCFAALCSLRRAPILGILVAVYVAVHSLVAHKEFRFLLPIVPIFCIAVAVGVEEGLRAWVPRRIWGWTRMASAVLVAGVLVQRTCHVTLSELGQHQKEAPWHHLGGINLFLSHAGQQADVCGVVVEGVFPWDHGGYSYLHRDVPLFTERAAAVRPYVNYAILPAHATPPAGFFKLAIAHSFSLYRRPGPCQPPPPSYRPPLE